MTRQHQCPRCGHTRSWLIRRKKRRCAQCRYEWRPGLPLRLSRHQWRVMLRSYVRGLSAAAIAEETGLHRQRVLRALTVLREAIQRDVPAVFRDVVDDTDTQVQDGPRGLLSRPSRRPVLGIHCREGQVWARVIPDPEAQALWPLVGRRGRSAPVLYSDTLRGYTGIAAKGAIHRVAQHGQGETPGPRRAHFDGLESFWGYLKRCLAAKGGIRRERLPLYLAEYAWRYNHRRFSTDEQVRHLLLLLRRRPSHGG